MSQVEGKYTTIHYADYLQLNKLLQAQKPRSVDEENDYAHDEMLFIIIHQVYELWFKQIIHEIKSVVSMFDSDDVDEKNLGTAVGRLKRVIEIQEVLIKQIHVLETLTPLEFLEFRSYLFPASGFQSFQFRMVEALFGLRESDRVTYGHTKYDSDFTPEQREALNRVMQHGSLFDAIEHWLERTPFLKFGDFQFLKYYKEAISKTLEKESKAIKGSKYLSDEEKEMRLKMVGSSDTWFRSVLDRDSHDELREKGEWRLSYNAMLAVLMIRIYRHEPILQVPYELLTNLVEMDELFTTWRYRHSQMVMRMLGQKSGTGGSPGYDYLHKTAVKHQVFRDFHNISTLLIPRSEVPPLPYQLQKELGFYFTSK